MKKLKRFFETPKKATISIVCMIAVLAILGTGSVFAATAIAESSSIGRENAKDFAFADAKIDSHSATGISTEFDFEHGQFVYDVEFIAEGTKYEYLIKASNGTIVSKEMTLVHSDKTTTKQEIALEEAKQTALADAGLSEAEVTFTKTKLDRDDGIEVYEIEFYASNMEYEYEINTNTGAIYSKSIEPYSMQQGNPSTEGQNPESTEQNREQEPQSTEQGQLNAQPSNNRQIDLETAKQTALSDAGLSVSEITFTKEKSDYEDGMLIFEIEFYTEAQEYKYEIDALTNTIHSKEVEAHSKNAEHEPNNVQGTNSDIGVEQAKSIAAKHAGFSNSDVTFSKAKLDREDGILLYEIEFYKNGMEYEYEIHATTGEIMKFDSEYDD